MDFSYPWITANQTEHFAVADQRTFQGLILALQSRERRAPLHQSQQSIRRMRFFQIVIGASLDGFNRYINRSKGGHQYDFSIRSLLLDVSDQINAGAVG